MGCFALVGVGLSAPIRERSWTTEPVGGPGVSYRTFDSKAARTLVSYHVYLPPHYASEPTHSRKPPAYFVGFSEIKTTVHRPRKPCMRGSGSGDARLA